MGAKRVFTEEQFEDILSMYYDNVPVTKICEKYRTDYEGLYKLLNKKGIKKRETLKREYPFFCNEKIFEDRGYHVIFEKPKNAKDLVHLSDNEGYLYTFKYSNAVSSLSSGSSFRKFSKYNPNTIYNLSIWLKKNKPHLSILSSNFTGTKSKVEFLCSYCNNKFFAESNLITQEPENKSCPFCSGRKVSDRNRLSTIRPDLIEYWDNEKNGSVKIDDISVLGGTKYWWKCGEGHSWKSTSRALQTNKKICPYCSGFHTTDKNRFVLCYPEIAKQAKPELNKDVNIYEISNYSRIKLTWECEFGHTWEAIVSNRTSKKQGCPYCSGRKVTDKNRLCLNFPDIYSEIDLEKNEGIDLYELSCGTPKKIWWKCNVCNKSYYSSVANRTVLNRGCPNCDMSHGEVKIRSYLAKNSIEYIPEFSFEECKYKRSLQFDFYLNKYNICIEYQGIQHYKPVEYFGGEEVLDLQKIKDEIKYDYCKSNNIPLIIIPYWEYDNIETIIASELQLYQNSYVSEVY